MNRFALTLFLPAALMLSACASSAADSGASQTEYRDPPAEVKAGFRTFTDTIIPTLATLMRAYGYYPPPALGSRYDRNHQDGGAFAARVHISAQPQELADLGLWEGSITLPDLHRHDGRVFEDLIVLSFAKCGSEHPWALLTNDGFLYSDLEFDLDGNEVDFRSDLPMDVQADIRSIFELKMDVYDWFSLTSRNDSTRASTECPLSPSPIRATQPRSASSVLEPGIGPGE